MTPTIGVFGSANMDQVVLVERAPNRGETVTGRSFSQLVGGKGANQALAAARAGANVRMVGAVGDDAAGESIRSVLAADDVDTSGLVVVDGPSGTAHITVDGSGENSIVVIPGANGRVETLNDDHRRAIDGCDALLLQLELPLPVVSEAMRFAHARGVSVMLTPAPVVPLSADDLGLVDVLVPNEHEAALLTGEDDPYASARALVDLGVTSVVVTLGGQGSLGVTGGDVIEVPAERVEAVDTTAAGDTFAGCLAVALAEGRDRRSAIRWATHAAALSVQKMGASTSMPTREAIDREGA